MRTIDRTLATLALVIPLALAGCQEGADTEEDALTPADTVAADTAGATTTGVSPGASTAEVRVTNPMPHGMTVSVEFEGGGANELGTIPANGSQSFQLAASPGETVRLIAVDEDETHSPSTQITLEETNNWSIGE